jgi:Zn finger protein HypA/HybF involved in hydrogenase expression
MGDILTASCRCGYETDNIFYGAGFASFENNYFPVPGYCKSCSIAFEIVPEQQKDKCPTCKKKAEQYQLDGDEEADLNKQSAARECWQRKYYCPKCGKHTLQFNRCGMWD